MYHAPPLHLIDLKVVIMQQRNHMGFCVFSLLTETNITGCPEWMECVNNPVRSFWTRASINVSLFTQVLSHL